MPQTFEKTEQPKSNVDRAREIIAKSREAIEAEFSVTDNNWLSCCRTRLGLLVFVFYAASQAGEIEPEIYEEIEARLDEIDEHITNLQEKYPSKEPQPPTEIKEELLSMLEKLL